jgi:hypothetical protein
VGLDADGVKFINDRKFDGPALLVKSAIESDRVARARNVIERPDPSKLGEWKGWSELGWIEDVGKYGQSAAKPRADASKGEIFDQATFDVFTKAAHGAKIPASQAAPLFEALFKHGNQVMGELQAEQRRAEAALEQTLKTDWGPDYPVKKALAGRAMHFLNVDDGDAGVLDKLLGSPRMVKLFARFGDMIGEDNMPVGGGSGPIMGESVDAIEADQRKFMAGPLKIKALKDPSAANHQDIEREWTKLGVRLAAAQRRAQRAA